MSHDTRQRGLDGPISGLGPHGEFAAPASQVRLSDAAAERVRAARFSVAVVLHTGRSDWSRLQVAGIREALRPLAAQLVEVVECGFEPDQQVASMEKLLARHPDAIISIPVDNLDAADAHQRISEADIKLVLMDNAPVGMVAHKDYVSVVSADNFGNGELAAEVLARSVPEGGSVTVVGYGVDFPVTNERELGFRRWLGENRPDVSVERIEFAAPDRAGLEVADYLAGHDPTDGMFVVWDEPALLTAEAMRAASRATPIVTVDLGRGVALEIARGGLVMGGGAQRPFDQGVAEATAALMALAGEEPPPWIALPALKVTRDNIVEAFETVWHEAAPETLTQALSDR